MAKKAKHTKDSPSRGSEKYTVVARRYRPQSFDELVGQAQVAQGLSKAISQDRVGHAYLFTGARGIGKTSTARIFAKALNCQSGPTEQPCNECDLCEEITAGTNVDVLEIDGASNRGIDEIRELRANANVLPIRCRYKVYIIDEVHMLTREAFNALLKTLEEPPLHVIFMFCTTDPDRIPITVLSRCQRFDFPPIDNAAIVEHLDLIVVAEGMKAEQEALQILARRANGSMRDSQSLLEQLLSLSETTITVADVHMALGTIGNERLADIVGQVVSNNAAAVLEAFDLACREGIDPSQLIEQLLGYFRDTMAATVGCDVSLMRHTDREQFERVCDQGNQLGLETIIAVVEILTEAMGRMSTSPHVRTIAETALVRICSLEKLDVLETWLRQPGSGPRLPADPPAARPSAAEDKLASTPSVEQENKESTAAADPPVLSLEASQITEIWQQVLSRLEDMTGDFASSATSLALSAPNTLVVGFPAPYTLQKESCERPERREKIEFLLAEITGQEVHVQFQLLPEEVAATPEPVTKSDRQKKRDLAQDPLVRQAMDVFDAEMIRVETEPGSSQ
jgi:DNA polymerase-3 subunit gamma/tau